MTTLLWNIDEVARQLGGVSPRTVRRLIARGKLTSVHVLGRVTVPASSVHDWINKQINVHNNQHRVGPDVQRQSETSTCRNAKNGGIKTGSTNVLILPITGCHTPTQAAKELGALLGSENPQKGARKRRRSSPSGR